MGLIWLVEVFSCLDLINKGNIFGINNLGKDLPFPLQSLDLLIFGEFLAYKNHVNKQKGFVSCFLQVLYATEDL